MKVIYYESNAPWVGKMKCPQCARLTPAWQSSGMSESFPHFYCDTCSNVLHRESDKELVYSADPTPELLHQIERTLPACLCGGRFKPGANPKCPHCGAEFAHEWDPVRRLTVPFIVILDGSCLIRDRLYSYQVSIGSRAKYLARVLKQTRAEHPNSPSKRGAPKRGRKSRKP